MSIGTRLIQLRNQKGLTQEQLSGRTGIAPSYLSRIENRRLEPSPRTLRKLAAALGVPVSELFEEGFARLGTLQCLITSSGSCVMNLLRSGRGRRAGPGGESYSPRQLQLLRMANYLIQSGGARVLDALEMLLGALLAPGRSRAALVPPVQRPAPSPAAPRRLA